jgi:hypothetical protein
VKRAEVKNVHTWADAFGIWHARVTYSRNPMADAQVAMWHEIEARQGQDAPIPGVTLVRTWDDGSTEWRES